MASTRFANDDVVLSSDAETDTNISEAFELSTSSGYEITSFLNNSKLLQDRVSFP